MWTQPEAHPGEYLRARFLAPLGLTAADLARGCRMPRSRVSDILSGKRGISADTAKRLAAFFRMDAETWMALQSTWELHHAPDDDTIVALDPPGFLIGPAGATPLLRSRRPRPPSLVVPEDFVAQARDPGARHKRHHEEVRYADGTRALVSRDG